MFSLPPGAQYKRHLTVTFFSLRQHQSTQGGSKTLTLTTRRRKKESRDLRTCIDLIGKLKVSMAFFLHPRRPYSLDKGVSQAEFCNPCHCRHRAVLSVRLLLLFSELCSSHRPKGDYFELLFILIQPFAVDWQKALPQSLC